MRVKLEDNPSLPVALHPQLHQKGGEIIGYTIIMPDPYRVMINVALDMGLVTAITEEFLVKE